LRQLVSESSGFHLLTTTIHSSYRSSIFHRKKTENVRLVAEAPELFSGKELSVSSGRPSIFF
jgi:hypothetical protein